MQQRTVVIMAASLWAAGFVGAVGADQSWWQSVEVCRETLNQGAESGAYCQQFTTSIIQLNDMEVVVYSRDSSCYTTTVSRIDSISDQLVYGPGLTNCASPFICMAGAGTMVRLYTDSVIVEKYVPEEGGGVLRLRVRYLPGSGEVPEMWGQACSSSSADRLRNWTIPRNPWGDNRRLVRSFDVRGRICSRLSNRPGLYITGWRRHGTDGVSRAQVTIVP